MSIITSITSSDSNKLTFDTVCPKDQCSELIEGYTAMVPLHIKKDTFLIAYNKSNQKTDTYRLTDNAPWIQKVDSSIDLSDAPWEILETFVLGNNNFIMTYEKEKGLFGFYQISDDLTSSKPYRYSNSRATPTQKFTTIAPIESWGEQYFLGYSFDEGTVASFSLSVKTSSWNSPPLRAQNVWYHKWSPGWDHFAFFKLGEANFFFKINKKRPNVNIDHILDDPANGGIPIGSHLERVLPDADSINITSMIPWKNGETYLLTHIDQKEATTIYRINPDCRSFTNLGETKTKKNVSIIVPYRIGNKTFTLFYGEES